MRLGRTITLGVALTVVVTTVTAAPATGRTVLNLCTLISRTRIEDKIGTPLGTPHALDNTRIAAGCHFPASAVGGTDVGLYASTNVPQGIKHSYGGSFFATLDTFGHVYGTPTPVTGIGTTAYTAFTPGHLAQGALLVLEGARRAVLIVLVGRYVTPHNTVTRGRALAQLVLETRQLRTSQ
jgi:hypothetical protein